MKIGVQTFTVRKLAEEDIQGTFCNLKKMDVDHVELAYIPLSDETKHAILNSGLKVVAIQATLKRLSRDKNEIVRFAKTISCDTVVVSVIPISAIIFGKRAIKRFANQLNQLSIAYQKEGFRVGFHHHDFEFKELEKQIKLKWILDLTDPSIGIVTDTYWTKKAHHDPLEVIDLIGIRLIGVHLRDLSHDLKHDAPLGEGVIDFTKILDKLKHHPAYQVIEQNSKNPNQDLATSIKYLKG
jgi:sugar phosphate isomerase/epimerase